MARGLELGAELTLDTSGFMGGINGMMMSLDQFANRAMGAGTTFGDSLGEGMNTLANMAPQLAALGGQLTEFGEAGFEMMGAWADSAGDFDTAMINLQNAGIGSAEEMETLRQLAIDTGLETMFSPGEAAEAMYELKSAGLDVTQVAGVLNDVLDITAASAGQLDMASSARLGVAAMNKFGLESQDVTGFMSDLVRMQEFSQIKFSDMETAIGRLGGTVGLMGNTSQDSFLTLIAGAMNAQMSAAEAGQAIAGMERSLGIMMTTGEEGKKQRALAQLGLSLEDLQDPAGEWIDMMDMVIMMEQGMINQNLTSAQSGAILQTMFNSNGKKMIMGMMQQGRTLSVLSGEYVEGTARLEDMRQQLVETTNATDLAGAAADRHIDSWNGVKTMWEGTMDTFSIVLGETIVPLFESFAIVALTVANAILGLARENTAFRWVVIGVVAAVSALAFVVGTALTFLLQRRHVDQSCDACLGVGSGHPECDDVGEPLCSDHCRYHRADCAGCQYHHLLGRMERGCRRFDGRHDWYERGCRYCAGGVAGANRSGGRGYLLVVGQLGAGHRGYCYGMLLDGRADRSCLLVGAGQNHGSGQLGRGHPCSDV
jgi:TP901 family phage tail tape measure protein